MAVEAPHGCAMDVLAFIDGALSKDRDGLRGDWLAQVGWCASRGEVAVYGLLGRLTWERKVLEAQVDLLKNSIRLVELGGAERGQGS